MKNITLLGLLVALVCATAACGDDVSRDDGQVKGEDPVQIDGALDTAVDVGPDASVDAPADGPPTDSGDDLIEVQPDTSVDTVPPPDSDVTAPAVKSTDPMSNQTGVVLSSAVKAVFTEPIDPATVTAASFTLFTGPVPIPGVVTAAGDTATLTPSRALCPLRQYTATLKQSITDLAQNALAADYIWSFTTGDGAWGAPAMAPQDARGVRVAMAENGDAFVMWEYGQPPHIYAARYDGGTSKWGTPQQLDAATTNTFVGGIAADALGNAVAVWSEASQTDIVGARYDATSKTWSSPLALDSASGFASEPAVAMSAAGTAMVVFQQDLTTNTSAMYYNFYDGTSWSGQQPIPDPGTRPYIYPRVASDGIGNFYASWPDDIGTVYALRATRFDGTSKTWATTSTALASSVNAFYHDLAAGPAGAFAAWVQRPTTSYEVAASRYSASAWSAATKISGTATNFAERPSVATDLAGNALVVWQQGGPVYASRYDVTTTSWSATPSTLAATGSQPAVVMDAAGNGVAAWGEDVTSGQRVRAARYLAATKAFGTSAFIAPARTGYLWEPMAMAMNACGQAAAIIQYSNEGPFDPPDYLLFR
ncbi:MAG: Ig-like domain-containing protein [Myxococcales bacterium]|nr:Ig-like domain-containing protein [Myxococcales bacterium]